MAHWSTTPQAEEIKKRLSEIRKANPNRYWQDKHHSDFTKDKIRKARAKQIITPESREKAKAKMTGEQHPLWKGVKVGYPALHRWVQLHRGKPQECEHCGTTDASKIYEWANIDGLYARNLDDFIRLCRSCHRKHDYHQLGVRSGATATQTILGHD